MNQARSKEWLDGKERYLEVLTAGSYLRADLSGWWVYLGPDGEHKVLEEAKEEIRVLTAENKVLNVREES